MSIREIVEIRDRLKNDLATVEKFLLIAKRERAASEDEAQSAAKSLSNQQHTLQAILSQAHGDYGAIGKTVLEAIQLCPAEFTAADVNESLEKEKRSLAGTQISVALSRLKRQGKIEVVKPKRGRQPAVYRKI